MAVRWRSLIVRVVVVAAEHLGVAVRPREHERAADQIVALVVEGERTVGRGALCVVVAQEDERVAAVHHAPLGAERAQVVQMMVVSLEDDVAQIRAVLELDERGERGEVGHAQVGWQRAGVDHLLEDVGSLVVAENTIKEESKRI